MTIEVDRFGNSSWNFYRKAYRKARWRKVGQRMLNEILEKYRGYSVLIVVI